MITSCSSSETENPAVNIGDSNKFVIGTFDSRRVAVAFYRSEEFLNYISELNTEYENAVEMGDSSRIAELDEIFPAQQELAHKQCFSTWPVDEIIWKIMEDIPGMADSAGVDIIISSWDIVFSSDDAEFRDITEILVSRFNPSPETLDILRSMTDVPPVPLQFLPDSH